MSRTLKPCGTQAAYVRHLARGEDTCAECRAAHVAYVLAGPHGPQEPAKCGTPSGYNAHKRRGETACADCKAARADYGRGGKPRKRRLFAECGTTSGYNAHKRRGDAACAACKRAHADDVARRRA